MTAKEWYKEGGQLKMDTWQTLQKMMNVSKDKKYRRKLYENLAGALYDLNLTSIIGVNVLYEKILFDCIDTPNVEYN